MPSKASRRDGPKRDKYALHACTQCQRRKVKCSGDNVCTNCRTRGVECTYSATDEDSAIRKPVKRSRPSQEDPGSPTRTASPAALSRAEVDDENKFLREQVRQLQRDIDLLFRSRNMERRPSVGDPAAAPPARSDPYVTTALTDPGGNQFFDPSARTLLDEETSAEETEGSPSSHGEADTFEPSSPWHNPLAVCSQISALRISVDPKPDPPDKLPSYEKSPFTVHLPRTERLQALLQAFFREFDCYFPCLHRPNMVNRLSDLLSSVAYSDMNVKISVRAEHHKSMAILCSALAFGSSFVSPTTTMEWRPGWKLYLRGKQLMQHFEGRGEDDLDVVTYHTISAALLLHSETLRSASHHVVQAFQAALNIGLNNQSQWQDVPFELASRQSLWWVLYFLDKRITQKCGIAYFIRENEAAVNDFRDNAATGAEGRSRALLQSMMSHSKLWTYIWDNFFAPNAPKAGNWDEVRMVDAKIVILDQRHSSQLLWIPEEIDHCIERGEAEPQIRRRLVIYLRQKCLRLSIRHRALSDPIADLQRRQSCLSLVKDILEAVGKYMSLYSFYRPAGYILTTSLVECIYHIVPEYRDRSSSLDHSAIQSMLRQASSLLQNLTYTVGSASRAFRALHCVLRSDNIPAESLYDYQPLASFRVEAASRPVVEDIRSLPENHWTTSKKGSLEDWLDSFAEQPVFPIATDSLPHLASTTVANASDCTRPHRMSSTPFRNVVPGLFYDDPTYNALDNQFCDFGVSR